VPLSIRLLTITLQDVPHPFAEGYDPIVEDPLVRIVNDFRLRRNGLGNIAVQADMLANDVADLRVTEPGQQVRPRFGVGFLGPETPCLGDVVQESRGLDQFPIEAGEIEPIGQEKGHSADLEGMGHDVFHHPHLRDKPVTVSFGRDLDRFGAHGGCHNRLKTNLLGISMEKRGSSF